MADILPAPRLQLAWRRATAAEIDATPAVRPVYKPVWACDYGLVLPLREFDIRREDEDGDEVRTEKVVVMNTQLRQAAQAPCYGDPQDTPYRDGVHAKWDSAALGGLPVYVVSPDGASTLVSEPE